MRAARRETGFTLAETLVAFVVLALVAGVLYRGFADSAGTLGTSLARYEAAEFGRSQLDRLIAEHRVAEMPSEGAYGEIWDWSLEVRPATDLPPSPYLDLVAYWDLTLVVSNSSGNELSHLNTTIFEPIR